MRFKKFIISLCFILLFYFTYYPLTNFNIAKDINTDNKGPIIYNISPDKCQQFIVAKPDIKINYKVGNKND